TWDSPHDRARTRAGERLWEVLDAGESEWLDRHLAECRDCRAVADSYEAQRLELRGLRDLQPVPPRDLWARTAAAIEREDARRRPSLRPDRGRRTPLLRRKRPSPVPLGAISGLLVVAVVVGVSLLGGRRPGGNVPSSPNLGAQTQPPGSFSPANTPIAVIAGDVGWLRYGPDGQIEMFNSPIDEVCAVAQSPDCAPIEEPTPRSGDLPHVAPQTVVKSPDDGTLVLVQAPTDSGSGKVLVVPVPTAPGSTPEPTATPVITTPPPAETATPPAAETPTPPPAETPTPPPVETPTPTPVETPTPTPTGPQEIASGVVVVGQSAAYSSDGLWFAFSAKPTDGSQGPDIYVWRVGDPLAAPITTDHRSIFSGWLEDGRLLGSRPALDQTTETGSPAPTTDVRPEAFLIDPATGAQTVLVAAPFWRPAVGPSGSAIYWDGTLTLAENGLEWRAGTGQLVLGAWPLVPPPASEGPVASPDDSAAPSSSPSTEPAAPVQVIDASAIRDWDARWDETGSHVAIWIADEADPTIGRLSLYVVDRETGALDLANPLMASEALPGFSIGSGRLAWATPPNQDGQGSHVEVLAWKVASGDDTSGKVESAPGEEQVVVIR
ncbi:MAG: hypothetical protein M3R57_09650, partial [Chloroflexota bacterium]|nr:hypothetical protein [Chloroflexota bacterium]